MSEVLQRFRPLFSPRSITFIGASRYPMKWGFIVLANLVNGGFKGKIYPVNPRENEIMNLKAYHSVDEVPEVTDLAVIVTPPSSVPPLIEDCSRKGIKAAVVITAGFAEVGQEGHRLQLDMADIAQRSDILLVGPNCNGIICPPSSLYPWMPPGVYPNPGPLAIVSQSGNVGVSVISRGMSRGFGFSHFVGSGNEAHLRLADFIEFFGEDPQIKVILSYVEGIREGKRFLEVAKKVTKTKPIVMIKAGETDAGARAAYSHTAALSGSETVFAAAVRQAGIIRASDIHELFDISAAFIRQPLPEGKRVGIVTDGGGWGVLAADACTKAGLEVAQLPNELITEMDGFLPPWWSRGNPVDLVSGMRQGDVKNAIEVLLRCPQVDGVIFLGMRGSLAMQDGGSSSLLNIVTSSSGDFFSEILQMMEEYGKPIILASDTSFGNIDMSKDLASTLGVKGLVCYNLPDQAAVAFSSLAQYGEYLRENGYQ